MQGIVKTWLGGVGMDSMWEILEYEAKINKEYGTPVTLIYDFYFLGDNVKERDQNQEIMWAKAKKAGVRLLDMDSAEFKEPMPTLANFLFDDLNYRKKVEDFLDTNPFIKKSPKITNDHLPLINSQIYNNITYSFVTDIIKLYLVSYNKNIAVLDTDTALLMPLNIILNKTKRKTYFHFQKEMAEMEKKKWLANGDNELIRQGLKTSKCFFDIFPEFNDGSKIPVCNAVIPLYNDIIIVGGNEKNIVKIFKDNFQQAIDAYKKTKAKAKAKAKAKDLDTINYVLTSSFDYMGPRILNQLIEKIENYLPGYCSKDIVFSSLEPEDRNSYVRLNEHKKMSDQISDKFRECLEFYGYDKWQKNFEWNNSEPIASQADLKILSQTDPKILSEKEGSEKLNIDELSKTDITQTAINKPSDLKNLEPESKLSEYSTRSFTPPNIAPIVETQPNSIKQPEALNIAQNSESDIEGATEKGEHSRWAGDRIKPATFATNDNPKGINL